MDKWLINGVIADSIGAEDRGLNYGDGLFETIAVRAGQCRFLPAHLDRLAAGCGRLGLPVPDRQLLTGELALLVATTAHATAKIIITRGVGPRGYRPPSPCLPTRMIGLQATTASEPVTEGVRVRYCETLLSRNPLLAGLKTLSRLEQVLAQAEWDNEQIAEGLMLNDLGEVVCGTMSNLFYISAGRLLTPALHECGVSGIMRETVLRVARSQSIEVSERAIDKSDLKNADDIFLTNSLIGLWSVAELAGQKYRRSDVTQRIMQGLFAEGVIECGL